MRRIRGILIASFLATIALFTFADWTRLGNAGEEAPITLKAKYGYDVRDFGARGDGKADDSDALQRAIDATAYRDDERRQDAAKVKTVILPPGQYRITKTLKLDGQHKSVEILGSGVPSPFAALFLPDKPPAGPTSLVWDGSEGETLMTIRSTSGIRIRDIVFNGRGKAGILVSVDSPRGKPWDGAAAHHTWERVIFANAAKGFVCGTDTTLNSANMSFYDSAFIDCEIGFMTTGCQHLLYAFHRCKTTGSEIAFYFKSGGCATWNLCESYHTGKYLKIDEGGINAGTFHLTGFRPEPWPKTDKRTILLEAKGEANVKFTALDSTACGLNARKSGRILTPGDTATPLFVLGPHVSVSVEASIICGPIARLAGSDAAVPTWIQFDNCRFRILSDPRKDIVAEGNSGYEFRNSMVTTKEEKFMIKHLVKYPGEEIRSSLVEMK